MVGERCSVGAVGKSWRVRRVIAMHMRAFVESAIVYVARNDVLLGATAGTTESRLADNVPGSELGSSAARNGTLGILSSSGRLSVPISHDAIDGTGMAVALDELLGVQSTARGTATPFLLRNLTGLQEQARITARLVAHLTGRRGPVVVLAVQRVRHTRRLPPGHVLRPIETQRIQMHAGPTSVVARAGLPLARRAVLANGQTIGLLELARRAVLAMTFVGFANPRRGVGHGLAFIASGALAGGNSTPLASRAMFTIEKGTGMLNFGEITRAARDAQSLGHEIGRAHV